MGDALLLSAAERLIELFAQQAAYEINLVRGAEEEVHTLAEELNKIRYVLDDAENRRFTDKNIDYWLSKLEHVSYEMEDVLDQWNYAILKHQSDSAAVTPPKQNVWSSLVPSCSCLCFKKLVVRHEIANKIVNVKSKLDEILNEKDRYSFVVSQPTVQPLPKSWRDPSTSSIIVEKVYGRALDSDTLVTKLMGDGDKIRVVSIVGVGGLGKTTIAQLVYNHIRLEKHFDLRIWVCVSDPFDLVAIAQGIIESVEKGSSPSANLETLQRRVTSIISGKKFLLVLDDVWAHEYGKWESLESYLTCGGKGSKILVTTRNRNVAKIVGTIDADILYPEMLSVKDCWLLMRRTARLREDEVEFEDIGMEIAEKCNGLPLAARTLGSLLCSKKTLGQWKVVLNSDIWKMEVAEVELFPHLLLSYNELSTTLKRCFSYCAVFPKDSVMNVEKLVGHWMALGYLGNDCSDIEVRGREYFDVLAMHSLFQEIVKHEPGGRINITYKMHDIVHDFAQYLRKNNRMGETRSNKCTICRDRVPSQISNVYESRILFWNYKVSPPDLCDCLTSLRVLSLRRCNLQRVPQIMENFIHLRWLDLSESELSCDDLKIVFQLYNLETLTLFSCSLKEIPAEIGNLIHLRNLDLSSNESLNELPMEIWSLINLRHLGLSNIGSLNELPSEIGDLINLTHLNLCWNKYLMELPREIENLIHLKSLYLCSNGSLRDLPGEIGNLINLTHLYLSSNKSLRKLPREIGNLIHLTHLDLSSNISLRELPTEIGNLIHLRHLKLSYNDSLKELPSEIGNLIHLRHLDLCMNESLKKLPETMCGLHELRFLSVEHCNILREVPDALAPIASLTSLTVELEGRSTWSKLGLLKNATYLGGFVTLIIRLGGENDLESSVENAREAELRNKIKIKELEIVFQEKMDAKVDSSSRSRARMDVMDALEPHPNLQGLYISKYRGAKLPRWMESPLNQLQKVYLIDCHHVTAWPLLRKIPCLDEIWIENMRELECIGREFLDLHECSANTSHVISFPKLKTLRIQTCRKWKLWEDITAEEEEASAAVSVMPCLRELMIYGCKSLDTLPHRLLRKMLSLEELHVNSSLQLQQRYGDKDGSDWKAISLNNPRLQLLGVGM